jgi:hypothetical protein
MSKAQSIFSAMYGWKPPQRAARSSLRAAGFFTFKQFHQGVLVKKHKGPNLIVNAGFVHLVGLAGGLETVPFLYIGLGTGTTAPDPTDTTLEAEIVTNGGERALAAAAYATTNVENDTLTLVKTFTITGDLDVAEAAIFTAATSGVMLGRQVFSDFVDELVNGDSYEVTYSLVLSA